MNRLPVPDRARVGLVSFSDTTDVHFFLNDYQSKEELMNALSFGTSGGRTNTQQALDRLGSDIFSSGRGDRSGVDNIAIVVTDGKSNIQESNTVTEAGRLRRRVWRCLWWPWVRQLTWQR